MNPKKINISELIACSGCDLLLKQIDVKHGESAFCSECGKNIYTPKKILLTKLLPLAHPSHCNPYFLYPFLQCLINFICHFLHICNIIFIKRIKGNNNAIYCRGNF